MAATIEEVTIAGTNNVQAMETIETEIAVMNSVEDLRAEISSRNHVGKAAIEDSFHCLSPFEILNPFRIIIDLLTDLVEIYIGPNLDRLIASVITVCHGTHIPVDSVRERVRETMTSS